MGSILALWKAERLLLLMLEDPCLSIDRHTPSKSRQTPPPSRATGPAEIDL